MKFRCILSSDLDYSVELSLEERKTVREGVVDLYVGITSEGLDYITILAALSLVLDIAVAVKTIAHQREV